MRTVAGEGDTTNTVPLPSYMTPPTQAPTGPGAIQIGGDPSQYIYGDPAYQALLASLHGNEDAFGAQMRAAIQRQALQSGYDIPELGQFLDNGMEDQIKNNPYSQAALEKQTHATNLRQIQNALAARGAYNSGELTYGVGQEDQRNNVTDLNNRSSLLDAINSLLGQQAQMKGNDAAQLAQELGAAVGRQSQLHPVGTANYDASTGTYVDAYGNHFNQDGSPATVGAPKPPPRAPLATTTPKPPATVNFNLGAMNQVNPFGSHRAIFNQQTPVGPLPPAQPPIQDPNPPVGPLPPAQPPIQNPNPPVGPLPGYRPPVQAPSLVTRGPY